MKSRTVAGGEGVELHVQENGNPAGKPILFIHGLSQCCLVWEKQMESELADTFRLVATDLRGHGLSGKPRDAYGDSSLWADDVRAVIQELELDEPLLVGWSYGGVVMSDYIGAYGEEEISGTVWTGAFCRLGEPLVSSGFAGEEFLATVPGFFSEDVGESVDALERLIALCIPHGLAQEERYRLLGFNVIVPPHVREGLLSRDLDNDAVVESMEKPMLLSWGEEDAVALPSMRDHLVTLAPHAEVSILPGVGHAPFWEAPERFNRELYQLRDAL